MDDWAILQGKALDTLSGLIRSSLSLSMKSRFSHHYHHQNHHSHAIADGWIETFPKGPLLGIHAILRRNWVHRWSCMRCCSIMRLNCRGISRSWRSTMRFGLWSQWRSRRHCLFLGAPRKMFDSRPFGHLLIILGGCKQHEGQFQWYPLLQWNDKA